MTVFIMEYRVIGFTPAMAMHPNPRTGRRTFFVNSNDLGTDDINTVVEAARSPENTPKGYQLFSVKDRDQGKEVRP
jgi:hypothetical protein